MWLTGDVAAGIEALEISQKHFEETKRLYHPTLSHLVAHLCEENKLAAVVEPYVRRCELTRDPELLSSGILHIVGNYQAKQRIAWQKRLLQAYATAKVDEWPRERLAYLKVELLRQLSGDEYAKFANLGPEVPERYRKLEWPEGNWSEFT
jgi:hypothetical protein